MTKPATRRSRGPVAFLQQRHVPVLPELACHCIRMASCNFQRDAWLGNHSGSCSLWKSLCGWLRHRRVPYWLHGGLAYSNVVSAVTHSFDHCLVIENIIILPSSSIFSSSSTSAECRIFYLGIVFISGHPRLADMYPTTCRCSVCLFIQYVVFTLHTVCTCTVCGYSFRERRNGIFCNPFIYNNIYKI